MTVFLLIDIGARLKRVTWSKEGDGQCGESIGRRHVGIYESLRSNCALRIESPLKVIFALQTFTPLGNTPGHK